MQKSKTYIFWLFAAVLASQTGCLVTRQEVRQSVAKAPSPEMREKADNRARYNELEEQMRAMLGKVEYLERGLNNLAVERNSSIDQQDREKSQLIERLKIYEETLTRMEAQFLVMSQKIENLQAAQSRSASAAPPAASNRPSLQVAQEEFNKKNWKQAIVAFERYRELNPKGRNYSEATYKIGVSFQELGMSSEAKIFYNEVVEKFPKSEHAKQASARLKNLK